MGIFSPKHRWGETIPTVPATQMCDGCGIYRAVSGGDIDLLPYSMKFRIYPDEYPCQKEKYTEFQLQEAKKSMYHEGFVEGQGKGIHFQDGFTEKFLGLAKFNTSTKNYEIPEEGYQVLKDRFMDGHLGSTEIKER